MIFRMDPSSVLPVALAIFTLVLQQAFGDVKAAVLADDDDSWPVLCPPLTYFSRKQNQCLTCSSCPMNQIITSPCHGFRDTQCGPFYNTELFEPAYDEVPSDTNTPSDKSGHKSKNTDSGNSQISHQQKQKHRVLDDDDEESGSSGGKSQSEVFNSEYKHWQVLTWVVCAAIVLLVVVITVGGILFVRRKLRQDSKLMTYQYSPPPISEV